MFGTDGIRGIVGSEYMNPTFVLHLGEVLGQILQQENTGQKPLVLIGKDTRISGYIIESALQSGLLYSGVNVKLLGPMPTSAIPYLTQAFSAQLGIMITASHNNYHYNGLKLFTSDGAKIDKKLESQIKKKLTSYSGKPQKTADISVLDKLGKARRINDALGRYIECAKSTFHNKQAMKGLRIVVDCANGSSYQFAPQVFQELGAEVIAMNAEPDGYNINEKCGSLHPRFASARVLETSANLGIVLDGDGDRLSLIDENGKILDGDDVLFILATNWQRVENNPIQGVVGTIMSNQGLAKDFKNRNIEFVRTQVGDKYLYEMLHNKSWKLGGEPSGHIALPQILSSGDGVFTALQVINCLEVQDKPLSRFPQEWQRFAQWTENLSLETCVYSEIEEEKLLELAKNELPDGRLVVRKSGTEPILRILVEDSELVRCERIGSKVKEIIQAR